MPFFFCFIAFPFGDKNLVLVFLQGLFASVVVVFNQTRSVVVLTFCFHLHSFVMQVHCKWIANAMQVHRFRQYFLP